MLIEQLLLDFAPHTTLGVVAELTPSHQTVLEINPEKIFPTASIIKIPIIIALYEQAYQNRISLSKTVQISSSFHTSGSGILRFLSNQVVLSIRDLVVLMIHLSDNTATNMLLSIVSKEDVNQTLRKLGIHNTELRVDQIDPSVDPDDPERIGVTTPRDMTKILCLLNQGAILNPHLCEDILTIMRRDPNQRRICGLLPWRSDLTVSHKTGTLNGVCHDVGVIRFSQGQYAVSILSKDGPVVDDPRTLVTTEHAIAKLSRWIFDQVSTRSFV